MRRLWPNPWFSVAEADFTSINGYVSENRDLLLPFPPRLDSRPTTPSNQAIETLLALDFAGPVYADQELGRRLAEDAAGGGAARSVLGLLAGAAPPVVLRGDALRGWLEQPDDLRVEE